MHRMTLGAMLQKVGMGQRELAPRRGRFLCNHQSDGAWISRTTERMGRTQGEP